MYTCKISIAKAIIATFTEIKEYIFKNSRKDENLGNFLGNKLDLVLCLYKKIRAYIYSRKIYSEHELDRKIQTFEAANCQVMVCDGVALINVFVRYCLSCV